MSRTQPTCLKRFLVIYVFPKSVQWRGTTRCKMPMRPPSLVGARNVGLNPAPANMERSFRELRRSGLEVLLVQTLRLSLRFLLAWKTPPQGAKCTLRSRAGKTSLRPEIAGGGAMPPNAQPSPRAPPVVIRASASKCTGRCGAVGRPTLGYYEYRVVVVHGGAL